MQETKGHPSFRFLRSQPITSLNVTVQEFEHIETGAKHYHIASEREENVFLVAFRTVPEDSKGVAHILEHTALCGSEHYPVRDPFFMMTRRSLNTFMNAFTSSDWTAYPFASQNRKDYFNLLDVYLDAVFFSRLDPLDFAQEGHRVEFAKADDPESDLVYKGVVFNEMKGAMSSPVSTLWQTLTKYLFPTTTYHFNSGGEPDCIPDLTYEELIEFYQTHYHPTNAVLMTFGNIEVEALQARFEEKALHRFRRSDAPEISVPDEKRYYAPVRIEESYALDQADLSNKTHHVMGWMLPRAIDLDQLMQANLLSRVLLDNSSSPLRAALESSGLGSGPSPLCGLEDSNREMSFMCGIEGSEPEKVEQFEQLVMDTLKRVAEEGVPQRMVEAQLHQLELSQREITGDGYPFGLQLILSSLSAAIHRGDPVALLNLDPALDKLREAIKDPDYIPHLVRQWLLDNPHRVRLTLRPDDKMGALREQAEKSQLDDIKAALTEDESQMIIDRAAQLEARQMQEDDPDLLPKVTLNDVPEELTIPQAETLLESPQATWFSAGTNGLFYQQVVINLPQLSEEQQMLLPLYSYCLTEMGCGDRDYRENQAYQSEVTGGFSAYATVRGKPDNEQAVDGYLVLSGKALVKNREALDALMRETLEKARFDELKRLGEIVAQMSARKEQSITGQGHSLAMLAASSGFSPAAALAQKTRGLASVGFFKELNARIADEAALAELGAALAQLHKLMAAAPRRFLAIGEAEYREHVQQAIEQHWEVVPASAQPDLFELPKVREAVHQAWLTSTQVSFCAKAYPTVTGSHADAPALTVLGDYLRNNYLHRAIREQGGAYGAGAQQDSADAVFRFFSYRDPRIEGTLSDFDAAIEWVRNNPVDADKLEEAVLGVVSSIDKPGSPAGEAKQTYHATLFGRTPEQRLEFRKRVLEVSAADLQRVCATYFNNDDAAVAVVTNAAQRDQLPADYATIEL